MPTTLPSRRWLSSRHLRRAFSTLPIAVLVYACTEVTAPNRSPLASDPVRRLLNPPGVVVVSADSMRGWVFYDDQHDVACTTESQCQLVLGPSGAPLGAGSAELATPASTDGVALVLADYAGTRLDQLSDLRYSTYRQSDDPGNNLAISLQLNVDYDGTDQLTGWQGRLVFEPYQGVGGNVQQNTWQAWDAKAGKWWGTKASVQKNNVTVANPCVQATPCSWTDLLAAFPDLAIHSVYGAVVLKAGSNWAGFRGNVDALTIGVGGVTTTYDFEPLAVPSSYSLHVTLTDGVIAATRPADSTYSSGARVAYDFGSRPGRDAPIVIVDDTLAPATGYVMMTSAHTVEVSSDTIFSYETLRPLERQIADMYLQLLTSSDKASSTQALIDFYFAQDAQGTDPDELGRATALAEYVVIDPMRDSAALRAVDDALANHNFYIDIYSDGSFDTYHFGAPIWTPNTGKASSHGAPSYSILPGTLGPTANRSTRLQAPGAIVHHIAASHTSAARSISAPRNASFDAAVIADPDASQEWTEVIYTNGIHTAEGAASLPGTAAYDNYRLSKRLGRERRFTDWTEVDLHYNRNHAAQMAAYDRDHPCVAAAMSGARWLLKATVLSRYASCKGDRFRATITGQDFLESVTARLQMVVGLPATNPDVDSLTQLIRYWRERRNAHVLLVGHSEGTIIDAQAIGGLYVPPGGSLEVANRCIAALALAPAVPRSRYGLDDYHLKGLLANGDIIHLTFNGSGWEAIESPQSPLERSAEARGDVYGMISAGFDIHSVENSYLHGATLDLVAQRLIELHRECIPGSATFSLSTETAPLGSTFTASLDIENQNNRPLLGRATPIGSFGAQEIGDSLLFLASFPSDSVQHVRADVTNGLSVEAEVSIPLMAVPLSITQDLRWEWVVFGESNGSQTAPTFPPAPTDSWDGSEGSCPRVVTLPGSGDSWISYQLQCNRIYHLVYDVPSTVPGGAEVTGARALWSDVNNVTDLGPPKDYLCSGSARCVHGAFVELLSNGRPIGRSGLIPTP